MWPTHGLCVGLSSLVRECIIQTKYFYLFWHLNSWIETPLVLNTSILDAGPGLSLSSLLYLRSVWLAGVLLSAWIHGRAVTRLYADRLLCVRTLRSGRTLRQLPRLLQVPLSPGNRRGPVPGRLQASCGMRGRPWLSSSYQVRQGQRCAQV